MAQYSMTSSWSLVITAGCMAVFLAVNLHNVLCYHGRPTKEAIEPEAPVPQGLTMGLVALGTGAFFLVSLLYLLLGVFSRELTELRILDLPFIESDAFELAGALILALGYAIFVWSVIARGPYATSWTMPQEQQLVDWGPYRYVRHPSYLAYFLMFIGFMLMWPNILALVPLVAIPGYHRATIREEEMLVRRFGDRYLRYRQRTGRFFPSMRLHNSQA